MRGVYRPRCTCKWHRGWQIRYNSASSDGTSDIAQKLRILMRSSAQPVAVVSTRLNDSNRTLHGVTVSSFSSVALHPLPLVAFSLRQPSRLADVLRHAGPNAIHGSISILAAHQSDLAVKFSRPDLHPHPFLSTTYRCEEDFPVLDKAVGTLLFSVMTSLPLSAEVIQKLGTSDVNQTNQGSSSELFITRVMRVVTPSDDPIKPRKPLVYYHGRYVSIESDEEHSV